MFLVLHHHRHRHHTFARLKCSRTLSIGYYYNITEQHAHEMQNGARGRECAGTDSVDMTSYVTDLDGHAMKHPNGSGYAIRTC